MSIIVPLDVDTIEEAQKIIDQTKDSVDFYKVHTLFQKYGKQAIDIIKDAGCKVFLDQKYHDIPNTVEIYAKNATVLGVDIFNLHTCGGIDMMKAAMKGSSEAAKELGVPSPKILGVTVLTSIDQEQLNNELKIPGTVNERVNHLAKLAKQAGLDGVVCSPKEITIVREACGDDFLIVTPGIRPAFSATDDQKRVMTPKEAVELGANYLVIGRPIIKAEDPRKAARKIKEEIDN